MSDHLEIFARDFMQCERCEGSLVSGTDAHQELQLECTVCDHIEPFSHWFRRVAQDVREEGMVIDATVPSYAWFSSGGPLDGCRIVWPPEGRYFLVALPDRPGFLHGYKATRYAVILSLGTFVEMAYRGIVPGMLAEKDKACKLFEEENDG